MVLADRLNRIIEEQNLTKKEFAERLGITAQYVYLLTGNAKKHPDSIAPSLAKLIALEFGHDAERILLGKKKLLNAGEGINSYMYIIKEHFRQESCQKCSFCYLLQKPP